jgi:anti-sigma-K factor RskA
MTPSKLWYAQKLASLRNDGSKPAELAEQMTIRRLCYEIEKLEEEQAETEPEPEPEPKVEEVLANQEKVKKTKPKSFWARLALDSSSEEEED